MSSTRKLPGLGTDWTTKPGDDDPGRRIRITEYLPPGVGEPSGVAARVLTSVSSFRTVMIGMKDFRDRYQEVTR